MEPDTPKHICVLAPNWLGDAAMCTPALRTLHQRFPEAELTVVGRSGVCDVLKGLPFIDRLISIPAQPGLFKMFQLGRKIRPYARDLTVIFPHSLRAAILARLCRSKRRIGYNRDSRGWLLTDAIEPHKEDGKITPVYMVWEYLDLLNALDCKYDGFGIELRADELAIARVKEHLVGPGPFVGIAPGAAFGPSKRWPVERFAAVADALTEQTGAQCVLLTGPGEESTRKAIRQMVRYPLLTCDEGRPSVDTLKATVANLDVMISNDSGPRHVAIGFNVPTICIMGSTKPVYTEGPYEKGEVIRVDVDCGPCQQPACATDHRCMTGIRPEQVIKAALAYLPKARV